MKCRCGCGLEVPPSKRRRVYARPSCRVRALKARHPERAAPRADVLRVLAALPEREFRAVISDAARMRARADDPSARSGRLRVRWSVTTKGARDLADTDRGPLWQPADEEIARAESLMEGVDDEA